MICWFILLIPLFAIVFFFSYFLSLSHSFQLWPSMMVPFLSRLMNLGMFVCHSYMLYYCCLKLYAWWIILVNHIYADRSCFFYVDICMYVFCVCLFVRLWTHAISNIELFEGFSINLWPLPTIYYPFSDQQGTTVRDYSGQKKWFADCNKKYNIMHRNNNNN